MKTSHFICIIAICAIAISCEKEIKYVPIDPAIVSALNQLADDFLNEKVIDREKKDKEIEELQLDWKGSDDSLEIIIDEKEDAFNKKWNDELLRRLGEKPEYSAAKNVTSLLIDYDNKKSKARIEWKNALLARRKEVDPFNFHLFEVEWEGKFIKLIDENPATLDYPGSLIEDLFYINTCTSPDGRLRFYSWDTGRGGTKVNLARFCQLRTADGSVHVPMAQNELVDCHADPSMLDYYEHPFIDIPWEWESLVDTIQVIDTGKWKYYLVKGSFNANSALFFSKLEAKYIAGEELFDFPLFDDGHGGFVEKLTTKYEENSFIYDEKSKTLTMDKYEYEEKEECYSVGSFVYKGVVKFIFDGKVFRIKQ